MQTAKQPDSFSYVLIITFLILLTISGFIAYQSIDWSVLDRLEQAPLNIPAPVTPSPVSTGSAQIQK